MPAVPGGTIVSAMPSAVASGGVMGHMPVFVAGGMSGWFAGGPGFLGIGRC